MRKNLFQIKKNQQPHFEAALEEALALKNVTDDRKHGEKTQKT
jgi:hypothetical protein